MYYLRYSALVLLAVLSFNLQGSSITPDPILNFDVEYIQDGQIAKLAWTVAEDANVDHYICEKSNDGIEFFNFSEVESTSESNLEIDEDLQSNKLYYRVKTVLKSGEILISDVKQVQVIKKVIDVNAMFYPNPVIETANIKISNYQNQHVSITVYNTKGAEVYNKENQKGTDHKIDFTGLESGTYFIKAAIGNEVFVEKVDVID